MTEFNDTKKNRKQNFFRATIWADFLLTIILVVFLFPSSQSHYAIPDSYPPQKTADPSLGGNQDALPVVNLEQEKDLPEKLPDNEDIYNEDIDIEDLQQADSLGLPDSMESLDTPDSHETPEVPEAPEQPNEEAVIDVPVFRGNPEAGKKVALTFDDGPYANWTAEYLKVLEEYQIPAVFFLVGTRVEYYPEIARKIAEKGFELGAHSYRHGRLTLAKQEVLDEDFRKTVAALSMSGQVNFFRPPYGEYNQLVTDTAKKHGLQTIGWNVDPRDWDSNDSDQITHHVLSHAKDGAVILLHEGRKSTLAALPKIITGLKEQGYQLVSVAELMK